MLDDFRAQANSSLFDEEEHLEVEDVPVQTQSLFLGMTPVQRLILALMSLALVCLLGTLILLVTQKIVLPF